MTVSGTTRNVPRSSVPGIAWPAIPDARDLPLFALAHQLEQTQWWPGEILERHQLGQAAILLRHARDTVPFYRERLGVVESGSPADLTMETWQRIPLLRRTEIQSVGAALLSTNVPKHHGEGSIVRTSGSTGRPIEAHTTGVTAHLFRAINLRYHHWHRRDFSARAASIRNFRGKELELCRTGEPVSWVPGHPSGPMFLFNATNPVGQQLDWLLKVHPAYLLTYASTIRFLLDEAERRNVKLTGLREVSTMGDALDDESRARCQRILGAPLHDVYSCQEAGMLALECPVRPHYHVQSESVLLEILDENDEPCRPGELGRVVITDLHNFAMPLIRYEIGDRAVPGQACSCGRGLPVIARITGRYRNHLILPNGHRFRPGFLPSTLLPIAPIRQIQLVQLTRNDLKVRLAVARPLTAEEEGRLRDVIMERMHHDWTMDFEYVDEIPRSAGGKYEDVLCLVDDQT